MVLKVAPWALVVVAALAVTKSWPPNELGWDCQYPLGQWLCLADRPRCQRPLLSEHYCEGISFVDLLAKLEWEYLHRRQHLDHPFWPNGECDHPIVVGLTKEVQLAAAAAGLDAARKVSMAM